MGRYVAALASLAVAALGADDKSDRATLRGVKAVCTIVELSGPTQAEIPISKERLDAELDGRLAAAGIPIDKNGTTCLYLNVRILPAIGKNNKPIGLYAVDFNLGFVQTVALVRDATTKTYAPTWSVTNLATVPADDVARTARQVTVDLVDRFLEAFRSVNKN